MALGSRLREWRLRRRMSQFDLAGDAGISTKHLSFLETGRSRPSRHMLLHLAACLDVPLRERNVLLEAAGYSPVFAEHRFGETPLAGIRANVGAVLAASLPNPAAALDRHWTMLAANHGLAHVVQGAEASLLRPPVNLLRLLLHPAGLAPRIVNLAQWRGQLIARLRRQIDASGDPVLIELLEEIRDYPNAGMEDRGWNGTATEQPAMLFRLATVDGELSFFTATTLFDGALDITVAELAILTFLPSDAETVRLMQRVAHPDELGQHPSAGLWLRPLGAALSRSAPADVRTDVGADAGADTLVDTLVDTRMNKRAD